jgi:hypothetical protein
MPDACISLKKADHIGPMSVWLWDDDSRPFHRRTPKGKAKRQCLIGDGAAPQAEFRKIGWDASDETLATAIDSEIDRLEREAATLRKLRVDLFGVA